MAKEKLALALFGGSGATGQEIITQAIAQGIAIRGLVRAKNSLKIQSPLVTEIQGSFDDSRGLEQTLQGTKAAIIALGPRPPYTDIFCATATKAILEAMQRAGIRRLVCQTGALIGDYRENRSLLFEWMGQLYKRSKPEAAADRAEQERLIKESPLDWLLLKPPRLTNQPKSQKFHLGTDLKVGLLSSIARADVARFILSEVVEPQHSREILFMRNS